MPAVNAGFAVLMQLLVKCFPPTRGVLSLGTRQVRLGWLVVALALLHTFESGSYAEVIASLCF